MDSLPIERRLLFYTNILIFCDNISTICLSQYHTKHSKVEHIDIRYYFTKDYVTKRDVKLNVIEIEFQLYNFTNSLLE